MHNSHGLQLNRGAKYFAPQPATAVGVFQNSTDAPRAFNFETLGFR